MKKLIVLSLLALGAMAGPMTGKRVASFSLPDSTGKYYDVLDYRGKVLVIEIMKTDCPHCVTTAQTLERAKAKYGNKISILSVVNPPDNANTVAAFVAKYKVSNPILFDFGQATAALLQIGPKTPTISLPIILVVDAAGIVREDVVYTEANKAFFTGDGVLNAIGKLVK